MRRTTYIFLLLIVKIYLKRIKPFLNLRYEDWDTIRFISAFFRAFGLFALPLCCSLAEDWRNSFSFVCLIKQFFLDLIRIIKLWECASFLFNHFMSLLFLHCELV